MAEPFLELLRHRQDLSRRRRARRRQPRRGAGRGDRPRRRERRRQVDADEGPRRRRRRRRRARSASTAPSAQAMTVPGAIAAGIAFVHQELNLFDNLDAAANVFIGREPLHGGPLRLVDRRAAARRRRRRSSRGSAWTSRRTRRSPGCRWRSGSCVEIAKALSLDSRLVIMDEPTSSLTLSETDAAAQGDRRPARPRASASSSSRTGSTR